MVSGRKDRPVLLGMPHTYALAHSFMFIPSFPRATGEDPTPDHTARG